MRLGRYKVVTSRDSRDCGVASLATILLHYGRRVSVEELRCFVPTDLQGTSLANLAAAADALGFDASAGRAIDGSLPNLPMPAIVHLYTDSGGHFVTLHEVTKHRVTVSDPALGLQEYTVDDFLKIWSGSVLLLRPGESWDTSPVKVRSPRRDIWRMGLAFRGLLFSTVLLALASSIMALLASWQIGQLFNALVGRRGSQSLLLVAGFATCSIGRIVCMNASSRLSSNYGKKFESALGEAYLKHLLRLPLDFFDGRPAGDVMSRLTDINRIRSVLNGTMITLFVDVVILLLAATWLLQLSPVIGVLLLVILMMVSFMAHRSGSRLVGLYRAILRSSAGFHQRFFETISNMRTVKTLCAETIASEKLQNVFRTYLRDTHDASMAALRLTARLQLATSATSLAVIAFGTLNVLHGRMSAGSLVTIYALGGIFLASVERAAPAVASIQEALVSSDSVTDILALTSELDPTTTQFPVDKTLGIRAQNVSFAYPHAPLLLKDCTFSMVLNGTVCILGESGCGKSTLARLLAGLHPLKTGEIAVGAGDTWSVDASLRRGHVCLVFQESGLMSGSILDNIAFGLTDVTEEDIVRAATAAEAHGFILQKERGYDTEVGASGLLLSSGQRQRIALARALLRAPSILILDEATSALDPETENAVLRNIRQLRKSLLTVFITHRMTTALTADRWLILENGYIVEDGHPQRLIDGDGPAASMLRVSGYRVNSRDVVASA